MLQRLYVLAFDHRTSLMRSFFRVEGEPGQTDVERAYLAKRVIWQGLQRALEGGGVEPQEAGILVDETYGGAVISQARDLAVQVAVPVEASGRREFTFEFEDWKERLDALDPTWAKALVRYNPEGDADLNSRQLPALAELRRHCRATGRAFMFELLVPPEPHQLERVGDDRGRYDLEIRPGLMVRAVEEIRRAGVEPDLWKIEGLDRSQDCRAVSEATRAGGRDDVSCVVLGRGADREAVDRWLRAGAGVRGYVGFAIGRSIWWEPLKACFDRGAGDDACKSASGEIAREYLRFVGVFEDAARP